MSQSTVQRPSADHIEVSGELGAHSVPGLLRDSEGWFSQSNPNAAVTVDLSGVERSDSAGVALLLEWWRQAQAHDTAITYRNAPKQMLDIIRFCALEEILPLA